MSCYITRNITSNQPAYYIEPVCEAVMLQSSDSVVTINDVFVLTFNVCVVMSSCGVLL